MFARLHTLETTLEQHALGLELVREHLLPWMRESSGFCGLIGLVSEAKGEALVITLWADEDAREASAEAGERLGSLATEASGSVRRSLDDYEISHFEIMPRADP